MKRLRLVIGIFGLIHVLIAKPVSTSGVRPPHEAPTISAIGDQSTAEDTPIGPVAISIGDSETSAEALTLTASSSNPALVPDGNISFSGGESERFVSITPAPNQSGTTTITVTVSDGTDIAQTAFAVTVQPVNDAPTFLAAGNQTVAEDSGPHAMAGWAAAISPGPADEAGQSVAFLVLANSNPGLFAAGPSIAADGTLAFTPAPQANGSATITIQLQDSGGVADGGVDATGAQAFSIDVAAVNDAPSFVKGADQALAEDSGTQTIPAWATGMSAGPADESGQTLSFAVVGNTNAALFSAGPAIAPDGTLSFTPAVNASGTATISVVLRDGGGTASGGVDTSPVQTFVVNVGGVNDAPSFTKGSNQTVNEDSGLRTVAGWATAISAGPGESAQTRTFVITANSNPSLFAAGPAIASNGTLTFTPAMHAHGSATITVVLTDNGGTANGGVDTSAPQSFVITINPVNDTPTISTIADQTTAKNRSTGSLAFTVGDVESAPGSLVVSAASSNTTLVPNSAAAITLSGSGATRSVRVTPAPDRSGKATITITVSDGDRSATEAFDVTVTAGDYSPLGALVNRTPTYKWDAQSTATKYELWIDNGSGLLLDLTFSSHQAGCGTGSGICSFTPNVPVPSGAARWFVRGGNSSSNGTWSTGRAFDVVVPDAAPSAAELLAPSDAVSTARPLFTWRTVPTATWYQVWIQDGTGAAVESAWFSAAAVGCYSGESQCTLTARKILAPGAGMWWVRTWNERGYGPWSLGLSFTIPAPLPAKATVKTPAGTIVPDKPVYTWNPVADATWYLLWVRDSAGVVTQGWTTSAAAACENGATLCSYKPDWRLAPGAAIWYVRAWNSRGYGAWSDGRTFTVARPSAAPGSVSALLLPFGPSFAQPLFSWTPVHTSTWYHVWVSSENGDNVINHWYTAESLACGSGEPVCAAALGGTLAPGLYTWFVRTYNDAGYGTWSAAQTFRVR